MEQGAQHWGMLSPLTETMKLTMIVLQDKNKSNDVIQRTMENCFRETLTKCIALSMDFWRNGCCLFTFVSFFFFQCTFCWIVCMYWMLLMWHSLSRYIYSMYTWVWVLILKHMSLCTYQENKMYKAKSWSVLEVFLIKGNTSQNQKTL